MRFLLSNTIDCSRSACSERYLKARDYVVGKDAVAGALSKVQIVIFLNRMHQLRSGLPLYANRGRSSKRVASISWSRSRSETFTRRLMGRTPRTCVGSASSAPLIMVGAAASLPTTAKRRARLARSAMLAPSANGSLRRSICGLSKLRKYMLSRITVLDALPNP